MIAQCLREYQPRHWIEGHDMNDGKKKPTSFGVRVDGDMACFTMPLHKVERISYECMTPTAARGILDSVFWKPEFRWMIEKIKVLNPIETISFKRNEIKYRQKSLHGYTEVESNELRTQRNTVALRNVAYVIYAHIHVKSTTTKTLENYEGQFLERLYKGKSYHRAFLGCREFIAWVSSATGDETPIPDSRDLGWMPLDIDSRNGKSPTFFEARLDRGVLYVPQNQYTGEYPHVVTTPT
jgi:CRISPR-associated protein Cas5d